MTIDNCTLSVCISTIAEECSVGTTGNTVTRCPPIPNLTDTCGWAKGRGVSLTGGGGEPERGGGGGGEGGGGEEGEGMYYNAIKSSNELK